MREPKAAWIRALQALPGCADDTIRWNAALGRWEFVMKGADGVPRSQFWGDFRRPVDPVTGLHPFRELDDAAMQEAIANLQKTFVANPHDGAGSTQAEVLRRMDANRAEGRKRWKQGGEWFAEMAAERGHRLRGAGWSGYGGTVAAQGRKIEIASVIGGSK
jgi:hypothetical protein